jgi:cyclohexyl-isocyanide hydratase
VQHFLRMHRRSDLRSGGLAQGTPSHNALGVISPAVIFWRDPVNERVVVEGAWVFAAGVTAGIDGALRLAGELRGDPVAQAIQLDMVYAPEPPLVAARRRRRQPRYSNARQSVRALTAQRERTKLGIAVPARGGA